MTFTNLSTSQSASSLSHSSIIWYLMLGLSISRYISRFACRVTVLTRQSLTLTSHQTVNGSTPLEAGIQMLPYSLGSSLASMPAAWFIGYWQKRTGDTTGQKWVITIGLLIATVGFGEPRPNSITASSFCSYLLQGFSRYLTRALCAFRS